MKQVCRSLDRSSFSSVGSLFHARGAATEKALSPIRRRVRGMTRLPHNEARSVDRSTWNIGNRFQNLLRYKYWTNTRGKAL